MKETGGTAGIPWQNLLLVAIALTGGYFGLSDPLTSDRPTVNVESSDPLYGYDEQVRSRLWQDPLGTIKAAARNDHVAEAEDQRVIEFSELKDQIDKHRDEMLLLPILVRGAPYAEEEEHRRRSRYAAIAALMKSGFHPVEYENIGATKLNFEENQLLLAFEWFRQGPTTKTAANDGSLLPEYVLVLWLEDEFIVQSPLERMAYLLERCGDNLPVRIIGPANSNSLIIWQEELKEADNRIRYRSKPPWEITMYSPWATASMSSTRKKPELAQAVDHPDSIIWIERTIRDDQVIASALLDELENRGVEIGKNGIVLLAEMDTLYGRQIRAAFESEIREREAPPLKPSENIRNLRVFEYMRGVDGVIAMSRNSRDASGSESNQAKPMDVFDTGNYSEKASGDAQLDYIRRTVERVRVFVHRSNAKAIGILGSDVYDNLLILQALRQGISGVHFFTTDIDARMSHPDKLQWTRNLIVASSFGLEMKRPVRDEFKQALGMDTLQGTAPPFRGSYQTAMYFAGLVALSGNAEARSELLSAVHQVKPRIFEIGRTKAHDMTPIDPNDQINVKRTDSWDLFGRLSWLLFLSIVGAMAAWGCYAVLKRSILQFETFVRLQE